MKQACQRLVDSLREVKHWQIQGPSHCTRSHNSGLTDPKPHKVWIALDDMPLAASVRYIRGSHAGPSAGLGSSSFNRGLDSPKGPSSQELHTDIDMHIYMYIYIYFHRTCTNTTSKITITPSLGARMLRYLD